MEFKVTRQWVEKGHRDLACCWGHESTAKDIPIVLHSMNLSGKFLDKMKVWPVGAPTEHTLPSPLPSTTQGFHENYVL